MGCGIYCIRNTVNRKVYVGSTVDLSRRWLRHRRELRRGIHSNPHLQSAWAKYGEDSFEFVVLLECPADQLVASEAMYIEKFGSGSRSKGYNIDTFIQARKAVSDETKARISAANKGKKRTRASRDLMSAMAKGRVPTPEARAKQSLAMMGHACSDTTRVKLRSLRHTDDVKSRISASRKGKVVSDATREALRQASTGRVQTEEHKARTRLALTGQVRTEEQKARMRLAWQRRKERKS